MRMSRTARGVGAVVVSLALGAPALMAPTPAQARVTAPAATSLTARPTATVAAVGQRVLVKGKVTAEEAREVRLQRLTGRTWRTVRTTRTPGSYSMQVPTGAAGIASYRVSVPATSTHRSTTSRTFTVGLGRGNVASTGYLTSPPARWDPCTVVGYRINLTGAPPQARADITKALALTTAATGVSFRYRGTTTIVPGAASDSVPDTYPAGTDVVIAYTTPERSRFLARHRNALATGGVFYSRALESVRGKRWHRSVQGYVVLDSTASLPDGFGAGNAAGVPGTWGQVLMHEIGHVMGLDHPADDDAAQIMYGSTTRKAAQWGAGDLAGLRRLGSASGCFSARASGEVPTTSDGLATPDDLDATSTVLDGGTPQAPAESQVPGQPARSQERAESGHDDGPGPDAAGLGHAHG